MLLRKMTTITSCRAGNTVQTADCLFTLVQLIFCSGLLGTGRKLGRVSHTRVS